MASFVLAARGLIRHEQVGEANRHYLDLNKEFDNVIVGRVVEHLGGACSDKDVQFEFNDYKSCGIFWKLRDLYNWVQSLGYTVGCDALSPYTFDKTTPFYEIFANGPEVIFSGEVCEKLAADFAVWSRYLEVSREGKETNGWIREAFESAKNEGAVSLCWYPKWKIMDIA